MRLFIFSLIMTGSLLASDFSTRYDVSVGMFGKVGYADVTFTQENEHYKIKLVATTTGTAATLTSKRVETYISEGHITKGEYIPDTFTKIKSTTRGEKTDTFRFDHDTKSVTLHQQEYKWVSQTQFDPVAFKLVRKDVKETSENETVLDNYQDQDVLSSYLNTKLKCNNEEKEYNLLAIGASNDKKDVTLSYLDESEKAKALPNFSQQTGDVYNLHVQPMDKEEQSIDVLIAFDNDGHMKEAVLADVFWIGEVKANRVYHHYTQR